MRLRHDPRGLRRVAAAADFGRVAVLYGGTSSEREISLLSGAAVLAALQRRGVDAHGFDPGQRPLAELAGSYTRAGIALHGPGGEDGSGVSGSAIGMDKLRSNRLAAAVSIPTPDFVVLRSAADLEVALQRLGLPMIVKPASQGSSVGMTRVLQASELPAAWRAATQHEPVAFAEPWITGAEYTVAILQGQALPTIRIEAPSGFYDYEAKYFRNDTRYLCPCGLASAAEQQLAMLALGAFEACGAEGWGRADFMMTERGEPLLLEINTVPGMTDHSLVPMAARAAGIDFDELVWRVLETSLVRTPC